MPLETWVLLSALLGVLITLYTSQRSSARHLRDDLKAEIGRLDVKIDGAVDRLDAKIDRVRDDLRADIARVDDRVGRLEERVAKIDDRVYALAVGLRPQLEQSDPAA